MKKFMFLSVLLLCLFLSGCSSSINKESDVIGGVTASDIVSDLYNQLDLVLTEKDAHTLTGSVSSKDGQLRFDVTLLHDDQYDVQAITYELKTQHDTVTAQSLLENAYNIFSYQASSPFSGVNTDDAQSWVKQAVLNTAKSKHSHTFGNLTYTLTHDRGHRITLHIAPTKSHL